MGRLKAGSADNSSAPHGHFEVAGEVMKVGPITVRPITVAMKEQEILGLSLRVSYQY